MTNMHPARSGETCKVGAAWRTRTSSNTRGVTRVVSILAFVVAACSTSDPETHSDGRTDDGPGTPRTYTLGEFPPFADEPLPGSTAEALQAALDATIEDGTF